MYIVQYISIYNLHTENIIILSWEILGTQRCPGFSQLLSPFTRTWLILSGN